MQSSELIAVDRLDRGFKFGLIFNIPAWKTEQLFSSFNEDLLRLVISVTTDQQIRCQFINGTITREYLFQPIQLVLGGPGITVPENIDGASAEFELTWYVLGPGTPISGLFEFDVKLHSENGLLKLAKDTDELYRIHVGNKVRLRFEKILPGINPILGRTQQERHFLSTIEELDDRLYKDLFNPARREYHLIRAASLLRQLLLDDGGSITMFAKQHGVKLEFKIADFSDIARFKIRSGEKSNATMFNLDIDRNPNRPFKILDFPNFIKANSIILKGKNVSVREAIKAVANGKGGNHARLKRGLIEQEMLLENDKTHIMGDIDVSLKIIFGIGRIVLKAIEPIVVAMTKADSDPR